MRNKLSNLINFSTGVITMVRNYKRKATNGNASPEAMENAVKDVIYEGRSYREAGDK